MRKIGRGGIVGDFSLTLTAAEQASLKQSATAIAEKTAAYL